MLTNADQLTVSKMLELQQRINKEKPMIVAVCEVKPKSANDQRTLQDYEIPGYSLHHVNLDIKAGRGIAVYTHNSTALVARKRNLSKQSGIATSISTLKNQHVYVVMINHPPSIYCLQTKLCMSKI